IYKSPFSLPIMFILISESISIFSSSLFWNQNVKDSIKATLPYMSYILFFLLIALKIKIPWSEKIILILGCLYILVFLISFIIYPQTIINLKDDIGDERGF